MHEAGKIGLRRQLVDRGQRGRRLLVFFLNRLGRFLLEPRLSAEKGFLVLSHD